MSVLSYNDFQHIVNDEEFKKFTKKYNGDYSTQLAIFIYRCEQKAIAKVKQDNATKEQIKSVIEVIREICNKDIHNLYGYSARIQAEMFSPHESEKLKIGKAVAMSTIIDNELMFLGGKFTKLHIDLSKICGLPYD